MPQFKDFLLTTYLSAMYTVKNFSITPHKAVVYSQLFTNDGSLFRGRKSKMPISNKQNGIISDRASKNLKEKINWMVFKSKKQKVTYPNGTISENFRISFITLTLPSKQVHSDIEIKKLLNTFLTHMREKYKMVDYVWKAELQRNDNIHFHITTNVFIQHQVIRQIWNRYLENYGYISAYRKKFCKMSYGEYKKIRLRNASLTGATISEESIVKSFNDGRKNNWRNPNSTDVKTVFKVDSLSAYLAKYLSKKLKKSEVSPKTQKRLKNFGNIWACSRSLSRLKKYSDVLCSKWENFLYSLSKIPSVTVRFFDYCEVFYFDIQKIPKNLKLPLERFLNHYIDKALASPL